MENKHDRTKGPDCGSMSDVLHDQMINNGYSEEHAKMVADADGLRLPEQPKKSNYVEESVGHTDCTAEDLMNGYKRK